MDMTYNEWRQKVVELATMPASQTIRELEEKDPFGTRRFEKLLLSEESKRGATLSLKEIQKLFPCPKDRISLPDQRDHSRAASFRAGDEQTFLYFQHLRKAGGTNFCTLAEQNLPHKAVPSYYCMPDMNWSGKTCAGCLHHWTNQQIVDNLRTSGHRIAGNEWDEFDRANHFDLPAVYATSFRRPLDRALSQFRFECIEDRGCKFKEVEPWWQKRRDLSNVYTRTFSDTNLRPLRELYQSTTAEDGEKRGKIIGDALDVVAQFHLVLVMEWLAYAGTSVKDVLGFEHISALTKRVRPHIGQFKRDDGQEVNKLGAAGIAKASWVPKDYLSADQYKIMSEDLALDEVLTDAGRRFFLERLVCPN